MGRKSLKDTRKKEIVQAFYQLSRTEGLENASIAKTADLLDMNPSLVIHYFKTKEQLVYELVKYILDKYLLIFNTAASPKAGSEKQLRQAINNLFSKKWNQLFDDSVSYSCYALIFRDEIIKAKYKTVLDALRQRLEQLILKCEDEGKLRTNNAKTVADLIFIIVDGAYYYLSLINDPKEYRQKLKVYKKQALDLLCFAP